MHEPQVDVVENDRPILRVAEAEIAELDINPVICAGSTLTAVDALIVRAVARK